jgi:hypothetical protein
MGSSMFPEQRIVDIIRQDEFSPLFGSSQQSPLEVYGLVRVHSPIVIAMNQQHGRLPGWHCNVGRIQILLSKPVSNPLQ